jgi:hypothetical protein
MFIGINLSNQMTGMLQNVKVMLNEIKLEYGTMPSPKFIALENTNKRLSDRIKDDPILGAAHPKKLALALTKLTIEIKKLELRNLAMETRLNALQSK